ncbi:MAG: acylneuraminate cytidylyltransferase family protein [Cytophagales bacterium]|nr:acylneuraminate cytidylyltransferase family protein [Cytophaga sp.]
MNILFLITARGGSKGIPKKNIKQFNGKPLIQYSIDLARMFAQDHDICVSTDDEEIISVVNTLGLSVPFVRPAELATDTASSYDVILHAIQHYESAGIFYDAIILLQPTSPLRKEQHLRESLEQFDEATEMVVSVSEQEDPSYLFLEENAEGYLKKKYNLSYTRRQDAPKIYMYNGAIYIYAVSALKQKPVSEFTNIKKYVMDEYSSIDIDTQMDWEIASLIDQKCKDGLL